MVSIPKARTVEWNQFRAALHEAFHAIAAMELGYKIEYVEVDVKDLSGITYVDYPHDAPARDRALVAAAGGAGELWWTKERVFITDGFDSEVRHASRSDRDNIKALQKEGSGLNEKQARAAGLSLVKPHRKRAEKIAAALLKKGRLRSKDLR